jgi:hypothetical protein
LKHYTLTRTGEEFIEKVLSKKKADPTFEKAMADEGLTENLSQWPEY